MKNILIIVGLVLASITSQSQTLCVWKGGAPGREKDWNCTRNWVNGKVPTLQSDVFIPDLPTTRKFFPEIYSNVKCHLIKLEFCYHIIDIMPNQSEDYYRELDMKLKAIASSTP